MTANAELCKEVADWAEYALTHQTPVAFDMSDWIDSEALEDTFDDDYGEGRPVPIGQLKEGGCGTVACIAGYVALSRAPKGTTTTGSTLYLPDGSITDCDRFARKELNIGREQAAELFYRSNYNAIARLRFLAANPDASADDLRKVF